MRKEGSARVYNAIARILGVACLFYQLACKAAFRWLIPARLDSVILAYYRAHEGTHVAAPPGLSKADFAAWIRANHLKNALIVRLPSVVMVPFVRTLSPLGDEAAAKIHPAGGGVVAIPHFAEFVPAIISVALCAPPGRRVAIFYESPGTVANNAVFNRIAERAIPHLQRDVVICHNNASGLACALKVVRAGGTLIIMPDVAKDPSLGTAMPFLSRSFVAMTGIGSIVRKTAVPLIPIVPRTPPDESLSIGAAILVDRLGDPTGGNAERFPDYVDYCIMRRMFESMDAMIGCRQAFWTYWLSHSEPFQLDAYPSSGDRQARDLLKDPLLSAHTRPVIDVSASAHE